MKTNTATTTAARPIDGTFPPRVEFAYTYDTLRAAHDIPAGGVNEASHKLGMRHGEPIIVILDCLLQYASTYAARFEGPLAHDQVLGPAWLDALEGVRRLLDGDGSVAMQRNITTDSKDNGACWQVYARALEIAGFPKQ